MCDLLLSHLQRKNWPKCRPMLRHSISEDVPEKRRGLVWRGYWAWLLMAAGFSVDWITITMMCAPCINIDQQWPTSNTMPESHDMAGFNCTWYRMALLSIFGLSGLSSCLTINRYASRQTCKAHCPRHAAFHVTGSWLTVLPPQLSDKLCSSIEDAGLHLQVHCWQEGAERLAVLHSHLWLWPAALLLHVAPVPLHSLHHRWRMQVSPLHFINCDFQVPVMSIGVCHDTVWRKT